MKIVRSNTNCKVRVATQIQRHMVMTAVIAENIRRNLESKVTARRKPKLEKEPTGKTRPQKGSFTGKRA